ncbi:MAG: UDP-N-acetylglucosamine 2-epimerase (non-hydrolyzing) [Flavobacteriales bacterium]|nr:UDP-N-acetylglucosamine 2-epimerase (non-hydrolyzing) [Flavobacteriales bacterium]MDW8431724.1 UDP-N-acetylglucosamine 2-epimerase (non-hydrolyzing) [Flavobacteriales bacterium]
MKTVLSILGARPQIIKSAALFHHLQQHSYPFRLLTLHTGQHYDENMSGIFYKELGLPRPDFILSTSGMSRLERLEEMLRGIRRAMAQERPDVVLVFGDTDSTLAGALAGEYEGIPVGHVEAGLRSHRRDMPEEINRILTDRLSRWLFCPTHRAIENLKKEGFGSGVSGLSSEIIFTGDVMLDNIQHYAPALKAYEAQEPYAFMTLHRNYNTDQPERLKAVVQALNTIAREIGIIFPVHPRTRKALEREGLVFDSRVQVIDPVGFLETLSYVKGARYVFTDSGGLQKEACFLGKPVLILRGETEWTEILDEGAGLLAGDEPEIWPEKWARLKTFPPSVSLRGYGDGNAARLICEALSA